MKPALPKGSPACIDDLECLESGCYNVEWQYWFWLIQHLLFFLLRTFSNRQAHKIDSDDLEFFRSFSTTRLPRAWAVWQYFYHTLFESCLIFTFFPPRDPNFRTTQISQMCSSAASRPRSPVLGVPVLTGLPCCGRFRARFQVMSRLQRFGSWCLVPPVWVPQGSPLVPPELIWILSWQRVNNLVKYAFFRFAIQPGLGMPLEEMLPLCGRGPRVVWRSKMGRFAHMDPLLQALEGHSKVILTARRTFGQTSHRDGPKIGATADQFPKSIVSLSDRWGDQERIFYVQGGAGYCLCPSLMFRSSLIESSPRAPVPLCPSHLVKHL